eukprot:TRINITY_DN6223_c0_g1_i2.p1 TRINITY_DN6223_c0_g1~~TRINITY_DN6223_c0_g1_i2.p1  ORF type:complete len:226 (-),score=38.42 TRINITY_DN6223_c0_g1_i2:371-1048(-)
MSSSPPCGSNVPLGGVPCQAPGSPPEQSARASHTTQEEDGTPGDSAEDDTTARAEHCSLSGPLSVTPNTAVLACATSSGAGGYEAADVVLEGYFIKWGVALHMKALKRYFVVTTTQLLYFTQLPKRPDERAIACVALEDVRAHVFRKGVHSPDESDSSVEPDCLGDTARWQRLLHKRHRWGSDVVAVVHAHRLRLFVEFRSEREKGLTKQFADAVNRRACFGESK